MPSRWNRLAAALLGAVIGLAELFYGGDWLDDFAPTLALVIVAALLVAMAVLGRQPRWAAATAVIVAAYVLVVIGNCAFDLGPAEPHEVQVIGFEKGSRRRRFLFPNVATITSWRRRPQERIPVRETVEPGERLQLRVKQGAFGFPWVASVACEHQDQSRRRWGDGR